MTAHAGVRNVSLVVFALLSYSLLAAHAQNEPQPTPDILHRRLTVTGRSEMTIQPDITEITASLTTATPFWLQEMSAHQEALQKLREALSQAGVESKDIDTKDSNVTLNMLQAQTSDKVRPLKISDFSTTTRVKVTLHKPTLVGAVITTLIDQKLALEAVTLRQSAPEATHDALLAQAVADAKHKADIITKALGIPIVGVCDIRTGNEFSGLPAVADLHGSHLFTIPPTPFPISGVVSMTSATSSLDVLVVFELGNR